MRKVIMPNFYINFLNKTVKSLSILCGFAVAPFTGAWIKIHTILLFQEINCVAPFTGAWIKILLLSLWMKKRHVAPFTGAWIKITPVVASDFVISTSHPSRVRGLKYNLRFICPITNTVAPFTGAWIKIKKKLFKS